MLYDDDDANDDATQIRQILTVLHLVANLLCYPHSLE